MTGAKVVLDTGECVTVTGVHPVADLFPMLDKEGLADLAASIGERGQEHPIVLDNEDRVLDGRNRLASCELAGVEPKAVRYEGDDPSGYALAVNIARRHLSTGARAIVAAQAARLNGATARTTAAVTNLQLARIGEAGTVLDWAPDLTDAILTGAQPLSVALRTARERKVDAEQLAAKTSRLKADAPDLAALVEEERMGVDDAIAALDSRVSAEQRKQEADHEEEHRRQLVETHLLCEHVVTVSQILGQDIGGYYTRELALPGRAVTRKVLADAAAAIDQLSAIWKERDLP